MLCLHVCKSWIMNEVMTLKLPCYLLCKWVYIIRICSWTNFYQFLSGSFKLRLPIWFIKSSRIELPFFKSSNFNRIVFLILILLSWTVEGGGGIIFLTSHNIDCKIPLWSLLKIFGLVYSCEFTRCLISNVVKSVYYKNYRIQLLLV